MLKLNVDGWHSKGGFYSVMHEWGITTFFAQLWKLNSHAH